jgi:hypothetical protein
MLKPFPAPRLTAGHIVHLRLAGENRVRVASRPGRHRGQAACRADQRRRERANASRDAATGMALIQLPRPDRGDGRPRSAASSLRIDERPDGDPLKTLVCFLVLYA